MQLPRVADITAKDIKLRGYQKSGYMCRRVSTDRLLLLVIPGPGYVTRLNGRMHPPPLWPFPLPLSALGLSFFLLFLSSLCVAPCICIFCSLCPTCCSQLTSFEVNHPQHAPTLTSCKLFPFRACSFGWVVYVVAMGGLHVRSWRWIPMLGFCRGE